MTQIDREFSEKVPSELGGWTYKVTISDIQLLENHY